MFIWRTLDKGSVARLLLLMAERDARNPGKSRAAAAVPPAPNAEAEIVPLPVAAKSR